MFKLLVFWSRFEQQQLLMLPGIDQRQLPMDTALSFLNSTMSKVSLCSKPPQDQEVDELSKVLGYHDIGNAKVDCDSSGFKTGYKPQPTQPPSTTFDLSCLGINPKKPGDSVTKVLEDKIETRYVSVIINGKAVCLACSKPFSVVNDGW